MTSVFIRRALLIVSVAVILGIAACSSSNSPTGYGGGGGGGGVTPPKLLNLGPFGLNQSIQFTFPNPGSFGYHCTPHRAMGMTGSVTVDAGGVDSAMVQVGLGGLNFSPSTAHIKPGGYVRWVNVSTLTIHTVTSD
jgi:hypothetical protein